MALPSYRDQRAWQDLQKFLPARLRLTPATEPAEEWWSWCGHNVHIDRYANPEAPAKLILHHGVGTNGRQMSLILGAPAARHGYEAIALDNLGYGLTQVRRGANPTYDEWVSLVVDFIEQERARDHRPIYLYGLSAGGMLTYHVAAKAPSAAINGIVGMCFLEMRDQHVRDETAHDKVSSRVGLPAAKLFGNTPFGRLPLPMKWVSKMSALANDPGALKVFLKDRSSAGNLATVKFLASYSNYTPAVEPQDFDACPVLLTQPAADTWTPLELSTGFLSKITRVPVKTVLLDNAGHYPLEEPGLTQLENAVVDFIETTR